MDIDGTECMCTHICLYVYSVSTYVWNMESLNIYICGVKEQKKNGTEAAIKVEKI